MLIPYRPAIKLTRVPWVTIAVCLLCLAVFVRQDSNADQIYAAAQRYCAGDVGKVMRWPGGVLDPGTSCAEILTALHTDTKPSEFVELYAREARAKGHNALADAITREYPLFAAQAPYYVTSGLWQHHSDFSLLEAISSTFSHASWTHVIGNLFFFVAFAIVVETVLGPLLFGVTFLLLAVLTGALNHSLAGLDPTGASLGLSGVVMGMLALAAYFAPRVKIRFVFVFLVYIGFLSFPLWGVAAWYVSWDLVDYLLFREVSNVGYAAHLAGAASGLLLGLALFRNKRHWIDAYLLEDEPTITQETTLAWKLREMSNASFLFGVGAFAVFFAYIALAVLLIMFLDRFAAQLLIGAPVIVGVLMLRRMGKQPVSQYERYLSGMREIEAHAVERAERILLPLAEENYGRAQLALARMYATASAGFRSEAKAVQWLERAAARGVAEARYELGNRVLHGEGVRRDYDRAAGLLASAAEGGMPEAAQALGFLYASGPPERRDREKAIEWYYRAGRGYADAGRLDEARAIIAELGHQAKGFPAVLGLVTKLEQLVRVGRASAARPKASG